MNEEPQPVARDLPMLRRLVWDELGDADVEIPLTYELFQASSSFLFFRKPTRIPSFIIINQQADAEINELASWCELSLPFPLQPNPADETLEDQLSTEAPICLVEPPLGI